MLMPIPDAPVPSAAFLRHCLETLARRGYHRVVTGALSPVEQAGFLAAGFDVEERLHLLGVDLHEGVVVPPGPRLLRAGRTRRDAVLAIDRAAFDPFWQFDDNGLTDAVNATPHTRFRVAVDDGDVVLGYAICGRAGTRGFVQRLAVDPESHRQGTGRRLLLDGMRWMRRHGVRRAIVNTQIGNDPALNLYRAVGFTDEPTGLSVLSTGLP